VLLFLGKRERKVGDQLGRYYIYILLSNILTRLRVPLGKLTNPIDILQVFCKKVFNVIESLVHIFPELQLTFRQS
jgi:hypothetical protein